MYGLIFSLFHIELNEPTESSNAAAAAPPAAANVTLEPSDLMSDIVPGPPFVFGALLVILALMVAAFIPDASRDPANPGGSIQNSTSSMKRHSEGNVKKSDDDLDFDDYDGNESD